LLSAIFWTWLWGPVGLLLSTPLLVSLKVIIDSFENLKPIRIFLGETVDQSGG
jgi:predicted PurR-regulated permease PerM